MGIKAKRRNLKHGKYSRAIVLPAAIEKGAESTLAADRIMLVDPRGQITEDDLLEFLEVFLEPHFWPWLEQKQRENKALLIQHGESTS